ncbi:winged helix-turn-helix transcriptional regulator [Cupriavidus gilardii]|uniref:winged helix-turn-helix transcriptional regulator n=1 Tax=Cupriavidus gilardii TaxID=82541 RepID=UPI0032677185
MILTCAGRLRSNGGRQAVFDFPRRTPCEHAKPLRTGELRRLLDGITEKMLTQQLREMEADGIVRREVFHEVPPRVEYSLTPAGRELNRALGPVAEWGQKYASSRRST